jgi:S1-C subfamily serine protease
MNHVKGAAALLVAAAIGSGGALVAVEASGGSAPSATAVATTSGRAAPAASTSTTSLAGDIYRRNVAGVVEITARTSGGGSSDDPFGPQGGSSEAQGTGFMIDSRGDIATNAHVVESATSLSVLTHDGKTYTATLVGSDPTTDVAVIHINAPPSALHRLTFGDSSGLEVGDPVVAIGNPFGLEDTLTGGIVSALDRTITSPNGHPIEDAIQTDAAINHGNSGGPLFDASGRVVGITSQIESGQTGDGNVGIGFAVPSSTVTRIVNQLISNGKASHPYIGIYLADVSASDAQATGQTAGVEITRVASDSPGERAGLHGSTGQKGSVPTGGDIITAVEGKTVTTSDEVVAAVAAKQPGDRVSLTIVRGGATRTVQVTLGNVA